MTSREDRKRRGLRRLSADEHTLWQRVTRSIAPLTPTKPSETPPPAADAVPAPKPAAPLRASRAAPSGRDVPPPPPIAPLERRLRQRLARGTEQPDRRIDLHGLTQRQAHDALARFLRSAQADGAKIVLVVTGKGTRSADSDPFAERGVLRRLVPQWLKAPEFRNLVLGFESAHVTHGGEGALYVRLRRRGRAG